MKIVYIAKVLLPSRTANSLHVMKMCQALADNGHDVTLYAISEKENIQKDIGGIYRYYAVKNNFSILWIRALETKESRLRYLFSSFVLIGAIARKLLFKSVDLVYGRDLLGCTVSALLGRQTIYESHAPVWRSHLEKQLFKLFIRLPKFTKLVVISKALQEAYFSKYKNLNHSNTLVAHDAADIPSNVSSSNPLRGDLNRLNVGYVGHLYKGKGVEVIMAVAPLLPNVNFHVIGGLEKDIRYWKSEIASDNIFFYGFIKQNKLPNYIQNIDVCLLPNQKYVSAYGAKGGKSKNISDFTSPLKMFEYMSYRKPIIASDLPVVPPDGINLWKSAIDKLSDSSLRQCLGDNAFTTFLAKYTWKKRAGYILASVHQ